MRGTNRKNGAFRVRNFGSGAVNWGRKKEYAFGVNSNNQYRKFP